MGVQLKPQQNFTVVRQIGNHTDNNTYFVQAVIRNAHSDKLLATLDLEDKGSLRFKKDWQVPGDTSGQGYYVSIITSVYTDDAYTTKSDNYSDEETTHLAADVDIGGPNRGGGDGITHRGIENMLEAMFKKNKPEPVEVIGAVKAPKPAKVVTRWNDVLSAIAKLQDIVLDIPTEATNISPLMLRLNEIAQAIETKPVTPETNLSPILDKLKEDKEDSDLTLHEVKNVVTNAKEDIIKEVSTNTQKVFKETNFVTSFITHAARGGEQPSDEREPEKPMDIKKLAS